VCETLLLQIKLKQMLPGCDVDSIIARRPSLLLSSEWQHVQQAIQDLLDIYTAEDKVADLVQRQPALLAEDVPSVIAAIER
jgi:hypothetical protein